jgi:hypothetical protein
MPLEIYVLGALALVIVVLFIWIIWLQNKLGKLLVGKSKTLDDSFANLETEITSLKKFQTTAEETFKQNDARLRKDCLLVSRRFVLILSKVTARVVIKAFATAFHQRRKKRLLSFQVCIPETMSVSLVSRLKIFHPNR